MLMFAERAIIRWCK